MAELVWLVAGFDGFFFAWCLDAFLDFLVVLAVGVAAVAVSGATVVALPGLVWAKESSDNVVAATNASTAHPEIKAFMRTLLD